MIIQVELKPEVEALLQKLALDRGSDVSSYVERIIERDVLASQSFDQLLAPIRRGFQESGMTDIELESLLTEAREEVLREKQAKVK